MNYEEAESFADNLDAQFKTVNATSEPKSFVVVTEVMQVYSFLSANFPKVTKLPEDQDSIQGLKVGKVPSTNGVPNKALYYPHPSVLPFQVNCDLPDVVYPINTEKRSRDFHPEFREGSGVASS